MENRDLKIFELEKNPNKEEKALIKFLKENEKSINQINNKGESPLIYALEYKHNENKIELLINKKTDINKKYYLGDTSLRYALQYKQKENIIKLLINNKTDMLIYK